MTAPDLDITDWLDTIEDERERQASADAFAIAAEATLDDEHEDVFTPFVYPH